MPEKSRNKSDGICTCTTPGIRRNRKGRTLLSPTLRIPFLLERFMRGTNSGMATDSDVRYSSSGPPKFKIVITISLRILFNDGKFLLRRLRNAFFSPKMNRNVNLASEHACPSDCCCSISGEASFCLMACQRDIYNK